MKFKLLILAVLANYSADCAFASLHTDYAARYSDLLKREFLATISEKRITFVDPAPMVTTFEFSSKDGNQYICAHCLEYDFNGPIKDIDPDLATSLAELLWAKDGRAAIGLIRDIAEGNKISLLDHGFYIEGHLRVIKKVHDVDPIITRDNFARLESVSDAMYQLKMEGATRQLYISTLSTELDLSNKGLATFCVQQIVEFGFNVLNADRMHCTDASSATEDGIGITGHILQKFGFEVAPEDMYEELGGVLWNNGTEYYLPREKYIAGCS